MPVLPCERIEFFDLPDELRLPAVARMTHADDGDRAGDTRRAHRCVVSYGYQPYRSDQCDYLSQQVLPGAAFPHIVRPVGKRGVRLVRVEGKDIPQEGTGVDVVEHAPDHSRRTLGDRNSYSRPLHLDLPSARMVADVYVVRERKAGSPAAPISQITSDPNGIDAVGHSAENDRGECRRSPGWSLGMVVDSAAIRVGIETILEA